MKAQSKAEIKEMDRLIGNLDRRAIAQLPRAFFAVVVQDADGLVAAASEEGKEAMPLICYEKKNFSAERLGLIAQANLIIKDYRDRGFSLTLRGLYYRLFSVGAFPDDWKRSRAADGKWVKDLKGGTTNNPHSYNSLGNLVADGRMGGLIDWDAIEDRTRASVANQHWTQPSQIIAGALNTYAIDKWNNQAHYVEVWVEKEALESVLARACTPLDVRFFCCRGYTSASAMWEAGQRLLHQIDEGKEVHIIHLGDHDPSGVHMSQDIKERLDLFTRGSVHVRRIALNMSQVQKYNLAPNNGKVTDSRFDRYVDEFGTSDVWELDALDPAVTVALIEKAVLQFRDDAKWQESIELEKRGRHTLECILKYFPDVVAFLRQRRRQDESPVICSG
ncbi:MAG: hypothetical protein KGL39_22330, partial [Patescibacteria group bacterium]|nr:hypothetical protein [Patescibacteria group bacterium]